MKKHNEIFFSAENICVTKKGFSLKNISFELFQNDHYVLLGASGSGKTMLLESIIGINRPDKGAFFYKGKNITNFSIDKRKIGIVYQKLYLFPRMSVKDNILFPLYVKKEKKLSGKLEKVVELLKIGHLLDRYPQKLSGGEQQRVALARTLIADFDLILLDEPFSALDAYLKFDILSELKKIGEVERKTFIHVTHDIEEALFVGNKVALIDNGEIVQKGTIDEVFCNPHNQKIAKIIRKDNVFRMNYDKKNKFFYNENLKIYFEGDIEDETALVHIPAEDIILSNQNLESSARNVFKGVVKDIQYREIGVKIIVDVGISLAVFLTKRSIDILSLKKGKEVFLIFKSNSVKVIGYEK